MQKIKLDIKDKSQMKMVVIWTVVVLALAVMLWIIFGGKEGEVTDEAKETADSAALKVAVMPTLDCLPVFVASEDSIFKAVDADVSLMLFTAQMDCDTALMGGSAQVAFSDVVRVQRMIRKKVPLDYYSESDLTWKFMANTKSRIHSITELNEKTIGITRFSATDYLAEHVVDSAKLKREKVFRVQINDLHIRTRMLLNNELDAALLPEPFATEALNMTSKAIIDFNSERFRQGVIAVRRNAMKDTTQLDRFAKAYDMAVDSINKNGLQHYRALLNKYCKVKNSTIDSLHPMKFHHITPVKLEAIETAQTWLSKH
ncbi:MAG: ABC transporter substrate-binding protein [Prevotellaceae bacterium]|nr:ABC transporter substrate-binding protein [Prevotellaceae bacterium]